MAYASARAILEAAMTDPRGIKVEMPSPGRAINLRQQLYSVRKTARKTYAQMGQTACPYDELTVIVQGNVVTVTRNNLLDPEIKITSLSSGKELEVDPDVGIVPRVEQEPAEFDIEGDGPIFGGKND